MLAYKVFMVCAIIVSFSCIGLMLFGYFRAIDDALKSMSRRID